MLSLQAFPGKVFSTLKVFAARSDPHPLHAQWFLTGRCNYRCPSCLVWLQPFKRELTTEQVKAGIDVLSDLGIATLNFTGGNPLLRADIGDILRYSHGKFLVVTIYDNGSLAHRKVDALKYADKVCISLNTFNPSLQDYMSGVKNAFQNAFKSIEVLRAEGIDVVVSITVSEANLEEVPGLISYFGERGVPVNLSVYSEVSYEDSAFKIGQDVEALKFKSNERMVALIRRIKELKKIYPVLVDSKTLNSLENLFRYGVRDWSCQALTSFLIVNELGDVSGCHVHAPVCKVWDLPKVWGSERLSERRREYHQCQMCSYLCYIAYSHLDSVWSLIKYALEYEGHRVRRSSG